MGQRRELRRGNQWSPSRRKKNGYRCALNATIRFAMQPDGCRTKKEQEFKLDPDPTLTAQGRRQHFCQPAYSRMGALISEPWRESWRRLSGRREQRAEAGPVTGSG